MLPVLRPFQPADADWLVARHGALYAADEGFDATFPALVARIIADFIAAHDPAREGGWIAWDGPQRVGSIFCVTESPATADIAKLRLVLVEPHWRGTGLAQAMLDAALAFARGAGYRQMRLWTHESHRAACRMYARNGFACISSRPARSFGQDVVTQIWHRPL